MIRAVNTINRRSFGDAGVASGRHNKHKNKTPLAGGVVQEAEGQMQEQINTNTNRVKGAEIALCLVAYARSLNRRFGTAEAAMALRQCGVTLTRRSIQRYLKHTIAAGLIQSDGCSPRGYWWNKQAIWRGEVIEKAA